MPRESDVIDKSGKWASAEEIVDNQTSEGDAGPSRSANELVVQNGHVDPRAPSIQLAPEARSVLERGQEAEDVLDTNSMIPSSSRPKPFPQFVPPPPPLPSSQGILRPSQPNAPINNQPVGIQNIPIVPVRRTSQVVDNARKQSQSYGDASSSVPHPTSSSSAFSAQPYPPPPSQPYHGSTSNPHKKIQSWGQYAYPSTPSGPQTPYQGMGPPATPQIFSSPAPMSNYIPSPSPGTFSISGSTPTSYPGGQPPFSRSASYPPPQPVETSPMYLPDRATQSQRPTTTPSTQIPLWGYGGTSQVNRPQTVPTSFKSLSGPSQQPVTPGFPIIPPPNQMPGTFPRTNLASQTPARQKTDAFVANDPFRPQTHGKHEKDNDDMTFDDIPMPPPPSNPMPMTSNSGPAYGGSQSMPPPQSMGYYNNPTPVTNPTPNWVPGPQPSSSVPGPSQGGEYGGYVSQRPSEPMIPQPGIPGEAPHSPPFIPVIPQDPTQLPPPHEIVPNQPVQAPQDQGWSTYSPQSPPPSPPPGQQAYDPYHETDDPPHTPFIPPLPSPFISPPLSDSSLSLAHYRPNYGYPNTLYHPPPKTSFWSQVGSFFRWPFSRRYRRPDYPTALPVWDPSSASADSKTGLTQVAITFVFGTLPSQIYLHFLLRLPSLYFSRVARIFEEADLTLPEIKKMALETASQGKGNQIDFQMFESSNVPQYERLKSTWESFIDSVMREWKTFNIISVLLLSAILTILQIQDAADDPITRYTALFSLICALISLLFGCMYIIRFGSMRKTYKAAEWALEAKRTKTVIWWNVWVLLAMPAIWLTWSIILYIACIMAFVWRSSPQDNGPTVFMSRGALLTVRVVITTILTLGVIYGCLILTTFSRYGEAMDRAWKKRIDGWIEEKAQTQPWAYPYSPYVPYQPAYYAPESAPYPAYAVPPRPSAPPYTDPWGWGSGYTGGDPATYASANYVPPPEPYDSSAESETNSPRSSSSTVNVTWSNTQHNKKSSLRPGDSASSSAIYNGPGYSTEKPLPLPPGIPISPSHAPPRLVPTKTPLAIPPPPSLPPIPGTPATIFTRPNSAGNSSSTSGRRGGILGLDLGDQEEDDPHENRVRFRSPLISAQGSFFGRSDGDAEDTSQLSAEVSGLSTRLSPTTPDLADSGQDKDSTTASMINGSH